MTLELEEIVMKLIGNVEPVGETRHDDLSFENLKELTALTSKLLTKIDVIASENKDRQEFSMRRSGEHCDKFLDRMGIVK